MDNHQAGHFCPTCNGPCNVLHRRSTIVAETPDFSRGREIERRTFDDYEYVSVARPVTLTEKKLEIPLVREIETRVPRVTVHEIVKQVPKSRADIVEQHIEVPQKRIVDKYVEVPIVDQTKTKYVPKIEVQERIIQTVRPEVKWVETFVDIPQVQEVVRYIESDRNIEQVIRYVPKSMRAKMEKSQREAEMKPVDKIDYDAYSPRTMGLSAGPDIPMRTPRVEVVQVDGGVAPDLSPEDMIVNVPVPFLAPRAEELGIDVPLVRFHDHFVPVPIRRHVIPRLVFNNQVFEVDCIKEKPILVVQDFNKPVPVNVAIKLREKDIKTCPMDPAEMSQADMHAMWMRVNADLFDQYRTNHDGRVPYGYPDVTDEERVPASIEEEALLAEGDHPAEDSKNVIPLHPGHPLMMTYIQNQWINTPTTETHHLYSSDMIRMYTAALDGLLHPQPHQVNLSEDQAVAMGPMPSEQLPNPWAELAKRKSSARKF